ncbi:hypothetical protein C1646_762648 [Rhizophagus diaphanus]|nr:hypothetical protein C1646_762648 [Rhizophagus diaphanus] [Rhizophagus sp. MUCL 43196]
MNSFEDHKIDIIENIAYSKNTDLAIIPGGLMLPLDIYLNKLFKNKFCEKWNIWMSSSQFSYTKSENLKKPNNEMDGSENDLFRQDEKKKEIDENKRKIVNINSDST